MIKIFLLDLTYCVVTYFTKTNQDRCPVNKDCSSYGDGNYETSFYKNNLLIFGAKKYLSYKYYRTCKDLYSKFLYRNTNLIEKCSYGTIKSIFNDPELHRQWYYITQNNESEYLSHELDKVWVQGITGKGVIVGIIGGGIEYNHKDLKNNFDSSFSYNLFKNSSKIFSNYNTLSTFAAGLISAVPNNFECGVGAAPHSKFANIQIFDYNKEIFCDYIIQKAVLHLNNKIAIYIFAWNFHYDIKIKKIPGKLSTISIKYGGEMGRFGLGSIYIMGAGNYRMRGNNCAFDGFIQMKEILAFGSISYKGIPLLKIERCSAIIASSIGTEYDALNEKLYSTSTNNICSDSAHGSISAASISAGIIALLISVNPFLTVRQIIFLIILSSIQYDVNSICNSGGFFYSYAFGFGMLNIEGLIELSMLNDINYIAEEHKCMTPVSIVNQRISRYATETIYIYTSGCLESYICVTEVEHTFITITLLANVRNTIKISLTSPSGTNISVIERRRFDNGPESFYSWKVKIMSFFGENPLGVWTLQIYTLKQLAKLLKFELEFHGSCLNSHLSFTSHQNIIKYICSNKENRKYNMFEDICSGLKTRIFLKHVYDHLSFTNFEFPINTTLNNYR